MKSANDLEEEGEPRYQRCAGCHHRNMFHGFPTKNGLNTGPCHYDADDSDECTCTAFISKWEYVLAKRRQRLLVIVATLAVDLRAASLPDTARIAEELAEAYTEEVGRQNNVENDE